MRTIFGSRKAQSLIRFNIFLVTAALIVGMVGYGGSCVVNPPSEDIEIQDWYDLDAVRDNLAGNHILMNDLDSTTAGYEELASPTANSGKGWQPIGPNSYSRFKGNLDGQGYEIRDLFINWSDKEWVGLFGIVGQEGVIENICVVNVTVIGEYGVGGLVGSNNGIVSNSYSTGSVIGDNVVGGLVGENSDGSVSHSYSGSDVSAISGGVGGLVGDNVGTVSDSYSTGSVNGPADVGGLVGGNVGTVSDSYSTGNVTGGRDVGGLVGGNAGTLSNSYSTGAVTGNKLVGGLVGENWGPVSNSYATGNVTGNEDVGGLVGFNFEGTVSNSFWDTQTSGQTTSDGGTGKNTTEMKNITTFTDTETEGLDEPWDMTTVAPGSTNTTYIWNIVNNITYPFLSWQAI